MMLIGIGAVAAIWAEQSPINRMFGGASEYVRLRLLLTGTIFAGGATLVVYSRLGQRSGAHINPAVTLAFWTLKKIPTRDALAYMLAQFLGATAAILALTLVAGSWMHSVQLGITSPGQGYTTLEAFLAEIFITFLLVTVILVCISKPTIAPRTGLLAGSLVALLVCLEAPISGTSLNPARSLSPALLLPTFKDQWIYLVGPPLGALLAVAIAGKLGAQRKPMCAKLYHTEAYPCIFDCGYELMRAGDTVMRENEPAERAYVIERGRVEVRRHDQHGKEVVLGQLGPRDLVGEMALLLDQPRSATVVALTDVQLRPLTRENFARVLAEDREAAIKVLQQLAQRLYEADRRITL